MVIGAKFFLLIKLRINKLSSNTAINNQRKTIKESRRRHFTNVHVLMTLNKKYLVFGKVACPTPLPLQIMPCLILPPSDRFFLIRLLGKYIFPNFRLPFRWRINFENSRSDSAKLEEKKKKSSTKVFAAEICPRRVILIDRNSKQNRKKFYWYLWEMWSKFKTSARKISWKIGKFVENSEWIWKKLPVKVRDILENERIVKVVWKWKFEEKKIFKNSKKAQEKVQIKSWRRCFFFFFFISYSMGYLPNSKELQGMNDIEEG